MGMIRYPLPITAAMLAPANANAAKPRYDTPGDWSMGAVGNDVDIATRSEPVVGSDSAATVTPYPIRTQTAKAAAMVPPLKVLGDLGADYGVYSGSTGRTGYVTPLAPYPDVNSAPIVSSVSPSTGGVAGGTPVVITGNGFTGATAVRFGPTAATAVVVVDANTITCTSPAKTAGTYDVTVTTPKGTSATGGVADNFTYA